MTEEDRSGITHSVRIQGATGYFVANYSEEMELYEVFVHGFGKLGSATHGWSDCFCIMMSLAIQQGMPLSRFAARIAQLKFEPNGETDNPDIPFCYSIPDYLMRWLVHHFGTNRLKQELKELHAEMERI